MGKKGVVMALALVVAVGLAFFCLTRLDWSLPSGNAEATVRDFNDAATKAAMAAELISRNEILLADRVTREGSDTAVTFKIYSVADGQDWTALYALTAQEADRNDQLTLVGTASASFLKSSPAGISSLQVAHDR